MMMLVPVVLLSRVHTLCTLLVGSVSVVTTHVHKIVQKSRTHVSLDSRVVRTVLYLAPSLETGGEVLFGFFSRNLLYFRQTPDFKFTVCKLR